MKPFTRRLMLAGVTVLVIIVIAVFIMMVPMHPVAYVRVVNEAGVPVAGAVVFPEGLRTKPGPYVSGWYGWRTEKNGGVANPPVNTDGEGYARVPYPKHVFERIETGTLCLSVSHPDFVPDRPERVVATALPAGAPWQLRANALWNQIRRKSLMSLKRTEVQDFQGMSDSSGLAVLPNVPATVNRLSVDHPRYSLPAIGTARDGKSRVARFTLTPGQTNRLFIQLEPTEQTPIAHY